MSTTHNATIHFHNGHAASLVRVSLGESAAAIVKSLALPAPRALLILNGGTAQLEDATLTQLQRILQDGLARVVAEEQITMITGGTDAGIFALFGQGRARWGGSAPCIGVAVADLVTWPGQADPTIAAEAALEPNHSHYVLVEGSHWGDETATMYALVAQLRQQMPLVTIFAGGGNIAIEEMLMNVRQTYPMIFLAGSGRATDQVLAVRAGATVDDARLSVIAAQGQITAFDINDDPARLRTLVATQLGL